MQSEFVKGIHPVTDEDIKKKNRKHRYVCVSDTPAMLINSMGMRLPPSLQTV